MTPAEVQAWVDAITGSYSEEEIEALEAKAHRLDVAKIRHLIDQLIDQVAERFELEVILAAMKETVIDLQQAVGDDHDDNADQ